MVFSRGAIPLLGTRTSIDPYTTFVDPLTPTPFGSPDQLAPNFAHYGLRYFSNRVPSFPLYDLDDKPWSKIFRWVRNHSIKQSVLALIAAFHFFFQYWTAMVKDRSKKSENLADYRHRRRNKLLALAHRYGWSLNRIIHLDSLRTPPVGSSATRLFRRFNSIDFVGIVRIKFLGCHGVFLPLKTHVCDDLVCFVVDCFLALA